MTRSETKCVGLSQSAYISLYLELVVRHLLLVTQHPDPRQVGQLSRGREVDSCDVCLLLNLGLLTEERARIVDYLYLLYVPAW